MSSTNSSVVPGLKSQCNVQRTRLAPVGFARGPPARRRAGSRGRRTSRQHSTHAGDAGQAVAVAEEGDEAPQVVGRVPRVVAGEESPHAGARPDRAAHDWPRDGFPSPVASPTWRGGPRPGSARGRGGGHPRGGRPSGRAGLRPAGCRRVPTRSMSVPSRCTASTSRPRSASTGSRPQRGRC